MSTNGLTQAQRMAWERDGYMVLDNFLSDDEVHLYNACLDKAFIQFKQEGRHNPDTAQMSNVDQVSGIIEYDDSFLQLMEHPGMMRIIRELLGNAFVMIDNDALIKPPQTASHTGWHRDTSNMLQVNEKPVPFMVKAFYFLSDVNDDGGCLAFVPGSVHMPNDILPKTEKQEDMPGHVRMNVKAGTAVLFHGHIYHSALNNFTDETRRSLIYNYAPSFLRTWPGYEPSERLRAEAVTNMRKMLLGVTPWVKDPQAFEEPDAAPAGKY